MWVGSHVRKADGSFGVVEALEVVQHQEELYNLSVEGAHSFFVGQEQLLAHNANCFDKAGIDVTEHFNHRLAQRGSRGVTPEGALRAYNKGRLYYNPKSANYIRYDSQTGISVVVDKPSNGTIITVFEGNPSPDWNPVKWRPGSL